MEFSSVNFLTAPMEPSDATWSAPSSFFQDPWLTTITITNMIRTQAKWFWRVFGEFSMGITLVRYPCCHDLLHPHHLTFNIGLLLFFPFLSRGRTGLGGGLSPTPVKSCFEKNNLKCIFKNWHGCRFSKFYPSIIFSSLQNFLWFFQSSSWAEGVLPPRHSSTRRLEGFLLTIIINLFLTIIIVVIIIIITGEK